MQKFTTDELALILMGLQTIHVADKAKQQERLQDKITAELHARGFTIAA